MVGTTSLRSELVSLDRRTGEVTTLLSAKDLAALLPEDTPMSSFTIAGMDRSPDGRHVAAIIHSGRGGRSYEPIIVVDVGTPTTARVLDPWPSSGATTLQFNPDGRWIAALGGRLTLWPVDGGAPVKTTAIDMPYASASVAWSPDGTRLAWENWWYSNRSGPTLLTSGVARLAGAVSRGAVTVTDTGVDGGTPWWDNEGQLHTANALGRRARPHPRAPGPRHRPLVHLGPRDTR